MTANATPPIDLAATDDFSLGRTRVLPSSRELVSSGQTIALEPRVMQVLVALAESAGRTLTRDGLIARCWGGVVVGDDAIQRCIGRLRKVAQLVGGFEIETVSRIGYRLHAHDLLPLAGSTPPAARGPLLAVLPFDNLPDDPATAYLGEGLADEILLTIARRSSIRAIGRTSSFEFRGGNKDAAGIERALGATHVLDGSVQCAGGLIRVAACLMDLSDKAMIWSDRFDGRLDEVFTLQDLVAGATVNALRGVFRETLPRRTRKPETFELVQQLRGYLSPSTHQHIHGNWTALERFEQIAGDDAEAWGLLAVLNASLRWVAGSDREPYARDAARTAAERALGLDAGCGSAHKALYLLEPPLGRFLEGGQMLTRAHEVAPQDGDVCWALYYHLLTVGRMTAAFEAAENAYRVDPLRASNALGYANVLYSADRRREAVALMRHAMEHWPDDAMVYAVGLWTAAAAGEFDFVDDILKQQRQSRFAPEAQDMIGHALFAVDMIRQPTKQGHDAALARLVTDIELGPPRFSMVGLCACLGADLDALYDLLDRADFSPLHAPETRLAPLDGPGHLFLRVNARLRTSPRFPGLCARLGLVDYWTATDLWPDCVQETAPHYDFEALCRQEAAASPRAPTSYAGARGLSDPAR